MPSSRIYPASEGSAQNRLCCSAEDGDQSLRAAGTRKSAEILKGMAEVSKQPNEH